MSMLVITVSLFLSVFFAGVVSAISDTSSDKARAQMAADAAALAAVAESGPYGNDDPEDVATQIARKNGAHLLDCMCDPGSTAVQVKVAVDGVLAHARAAYDPKALSPVDFSAGGRLHPRLSRAIEQLIATSGGAVWLESGYRSHERQAALWAEALLKHGSPEAADDWVAPPGRSKHEAGLAVDLGGDVEKAARVAESLGLPLHRPLGNEPWHFELEGSR